MKNILITLLTIGILVCLYFNYRAYTQQPSTTPSHEQIMEVVLEMNVNVDKFIHEIKSGQSNVDETHLNETIINTRDILDNLKQSTLSPSDQDFYFQVNLLLESQIKMMNLVLSQRG
jgi:hypothetical protein